jgi:hypothetical protein
VASKARLVGSGALAMNIAPAFPVPIVAVEVLRNATRYDANGRYGLIFSNMLGLDGPCSVVVLRFALYTKKPVAPESSVFALGR